jgi:hypothetical protein
MRVFIFFLLVVVSPIYAFEEQKLPIPKGWVVYSESFYNVIDINVSVSQYNDIKNYYAGNGKIVRNIYKLPGRIPDRQEEIILDKETAAKFEKALANVKSELKVLLGKSNKPLEYTESYTLGRLFFPNKIVLEALVSQRLRNGDSVDTTGNEDLDFVFRTLSTPKVD